MRLHIKQIFTIIFNGDGVSRSEAPFCDDQRSWCPATATNSDETSVEITPTEVRELVEIAKSSVVSTTCK